MPGSPSTWSRRRRATRALEDGSRVGFRSGAGWSMEACNPVLCWWPDVHHRRVERNRSLIFTVLRGLACGFGVFTREKLIAKRGLKGLTQSPGKSEPVRFPMEALVQMFGGAATLIAVLGGAMATIFFAWAGIQWMMASGDPQKIGQARMALIGAAIGLVIVGAAFIVPEVISERIIEPAGGTAIENTAGLSCDRVLKNQIVFQRAASTPVRMNAVIKQIQAQRTECAADIWDVKVFEGGDATAWTTASDTVGGCMWAAAHTKIGDTDVPRGLQQGGRAVTKDNAVLGSRRDSENNVIVHFQSNKLPTDSAKCWLYSSRLRVWDQEY